MSDDEFDFSEINAYHKAGEQKRDQLRKENEENDDDFWDDIIDGIEMEEK